MLDFEKRLQSISQQTILCVGDLMLDDFVYGEVARISPEAPAPVLAVRRNEMAIGGAGNVARNVASLGARCIFVGLVGDDGAGREVVARLQADPLIEPSLVIDPTRPTTRKVRFVSEHFSTHLLRADWEQAGPVDADREGELIARALAALPRVGAVVLSDYAKGVLTPRVIRDVIDAAKRARIPVIVDPKAADYSVYRGATVITPNRRELSAATRREAVGDAAIQAAAEQLAGIVACEAVVVTRTEEGVSLHAKGQGPVHVVVGLNSDASVTRLKGKGRPIQDIASRADVLAALEAIDLVVVFEEDTPLELIRQVRPAVLVKGGDYTREKVVGHEVVEAYGGEVVLVDLVPGHSTTNMVARSGGQPKTGT